MVQNLPSQVEDFFQRSLTAHLPPEKFEKLQKTKVLVAGLGGGSNITELMVRKGFGKLIIADIDVYECHNIRQRFSLASTQGKKKVSVAEERLRDINPSVEVTAIHDGITLDNAEDLVRQSDIVVDMLDLHALQEKLALHRAARQQSKYIMAVPSVINGAVLWVFSPDGMTFEEFSKYRKELSMSEYAWQLLNIAIPRFPSEELKELYRQAAYGKRSIPLDAVGVDQAAVMAVTALENIAFGQLENILIVPQGIQVDVSQPDKAVQIVNVGSKITSC